VPGCVSIRGAGRQLVSARLQSRELSGSRSDSGNVSGADAGGCKLWTLAPSGTIFTGTDPNPKNVAKLLQINSFCDILADLGDY